MPSGVAESEFFVTVFYVAIAGSKYKMSVIKLGTVFLEEVYIADEIQNRMF